MSALSTFFVKTPCYSKDTDYALPTLDIKSHPSLEFKLSSNTKIDKSGPSSVTDYYVSIPFDESLYS